MKTKLKFPEDDGAICIANIKRDYLSCAFDIGSNGIDYIVAGGIHRFPNTDVDTGILILSTKKFKGSTKYSYNGSKFSSKNTSSICLGSTRIMIEEFANPRFKEAFEKIVKANKGSIYLQII